ncbi:MAG: hypothetical protein AB7E79_04555 [Rhodospirillaceae bacterium]
MTAAALRKTQDADLEIEPVGRQAAPKMTVVSSNVACRNPDELLRLLYIDPQDGIVVDELLASDTK